MIRGTARCFSRETMTLIEHNMRRIASGVAEGFGAAAELDYRSSYPPLINDANEAGFMADVAAELVGEHNVDRDAEMAMVSEDFALMLERRPGAYIQIGNTNAPGTHGLHQAGYDFNDAILPLGASLYARLVERKLARR